MFPMSHVARKHMMVGGGIGVTPFLAYMTALKHAQMPFELHHFCRDEEVPIFERILSGFDASKIHIHPASVSFDLRPQLMSQPLGTHFYTCGPQGLMDLALATARDHGWPASKLSRNLRRRPRRRRSVHRDPEAVRPRSQGSR